MIINQGEDNYGDDQKIDGGILYKHMFIDVVTVYLNLSDFRLQYFTH
jgi:hypothetical protein